MTLSVEKEDNRFRVEWQGYSTDWLPDTASNRKTILVLLRYLRGENGKPVIEPEFCLFCSACQKVCPKESINVKRSWVFHSDINAAAWLTALKKLTSTETLIRELQVESGKKRVSAVKRRKPNLT